MVRALVVAAVVLLTAAAPATAHKTCRLGYLTIATSITSLHASHVSCSTARSLADQARHGLYRRRPSRRLPRSFRPRGAAGPWRLRYRTLRYYNKQPTVRVRVTMTRGSRSVVFVAWVDSDKAPHLGAPYARVLADHAATRITPPPPPGGRPGRRRRPTSCRPPRAATSGRPQRPSGPVVPVAAGQAITARGCR